MELFVTAIGTDSGKTLVSAILCEILGATYWKPVQAGLPTDTDWLMQHISSQAIMAWPEAYRLKEPMSPHAAAAKEGILIDLDKIQKPKTRAHLVIEGAGGLMVPLNNHDFVIDMPQEWHVPVVLVSNLYLGSINHTILSVNELHRRNIQVAGIVFNGPENKASEDFILNYSKYPLLFRIPKLASVDKGIIRALANELRHEVLEKLNLRLSELTAH